MSTPVLTKKQQKQTLAAKKGSAKGLKNVLALPQSIYWPILKGDQCVTLEILLKQLLPSIRRPIIKIPWSQRKEMSKEEWIRARNEALVKENTLVNKDNISSVIMGVNAVTRALEKNDVCCVLIDANVDPPLLIKHIITMAQHKNIPVLLVSFLKSVTSNSIGFASAAIALKKIVTESHTHYFYTLYKKILDLSTNLPPPKDSLQILKPNDMLSNNEDYQEYVESKEEPSLIETKNITVSTDPYKYRSSRKHRTFIPPNSELGFQSVQQDGFIAFGSNSDSEDNMISSVPKNRRYVNIHTEKKNIREKEKVKKPSVDPQIINKQKDKVQRNVKYLSLKVKRLQGNSNRIKATKTTKRKKS